MEYNFRFGTLLRYTDEVVHGVVLTLQLSATTMAIGLVIGLAVAIVSTSHLAALRAPARAYVELIRNTPLLVQLFIVFFGLPTLGIKLNANTAAMIALSVNLGAYSAEIIRAGIESIRKSQIEAGRSLGLTAAQTFQHVFAAVYWLVFVRRPAR